MNSEPRGGDRESRLDQVVATILGELDSGSTPDRRAWLTRYPEFFDELSDFFSDRDEVERIAAPLRDLAGGTDNAFALQGLDPPFHPEHLGRLGGYEVTDWLGQGGMGVVFKAVDETLNRHVAIKVMVPQWSADAAARRRFAREAQAAAAISHPHVVTIHAVSEWRGRSYLVMEYISGPSLEQRIRERGPLELKEILRIGSQVASGLAAAHAQGLIHRDVKPANIMLENDLPRVKLTDFGLARAVDDVRLTQHGILAGTPQYMAPEQARGERLDRRSDLFSLGSVLYALCTGRPAFAGESTPEVIHRVCEGTPPAIEELNPDIPKWLVEIVGRLHAKDPSDRFQSAGEVAELLERHLAGLQDPSLPPIVHNWVAHQAPAARASGLHQLVGNRWVASLFLVLLGSAMTFEVMRFLAPPPVPNLLPALDVDQEGLGGTPDRAASSGKDKKSSGGIDEKRAAPLREYASNFNEPVDYRRLRLVAGAAAGSAIHQDSRGIRIVAGSQGSPPAVEVLFTVKGDFEITAAYEVPQEKRPEAAGSIGPSLRIAGERGGDAFASLTRPLRGAHSGVEIVYRPRPSAKIGGLVVPDPTGATTGKLRVVRQGTTLSYSLADGTTDLFQEVAKGEFGYGECQGIRLSTSVVEPGAGPRVLLWRSVAIRAGESIEPREYSDPALIASKLPPPLPRGTPLSELDASRLVQAYDQSFLNKSYDFRWLRIAAPGGATSLVRPDPRGVRITIPAKLGESVAIETKFGIRGDFDLKATYEILSIQTPTVGFGIGPELLVKPPGNWDKTASLSRFARPKDTVYSAAIVKKIGDSTQVDGAWPATVAKKGMFRLVRTGATMHFLVAEGESQDFREINQGELGTDDLEMARISAVTGGSPSAVDVLWKNLTVRAESLPGLPGGTPVAKRFSWRIPALAVAVMGIAGAGLWRRAVAAKNSKKKGTPHPDSESDWDDHLLDKLEAHAVAYAGSHPDAHDYSEPPRFRFGLQAGVLHGPFVVWAPVSKAAMKRMGATWEEICEKLPKRFEGAYRNGKRNGSFVYRNGSGNALVRRYRDGELIE